MKNLLLVIFVVSSLNALAVDLGDYSITRIDSSADAELQSSLPFKKDILVFDDYTSYKNELGLQYYFDLNYDTRKQFAPIELFFNTAKTNSSLVNLDQFIDEKIALTEELKDMDNVKEVYALQAKKLKIKYILFEKDISKTKKRKPIYQASISIRFGALIVEGDIIHSIDQDHSQKVEELVNEMKTKIKNRIELLDKRFVEKENAKSFWDKIF